MSDLNGQSFDGVNLFSSDFRSLLNEMAELCGRLSRFQPGPNLIGQNTPSGLALAAAFPDDPEGALEAFPAVITDSNNEGMHAWAEVYYPKDKNGAPEEVTEGRRGSITDGPAREFSSHYHVARTAPGSVVLMFSGADITADEPGSMPHSEEPAEAKYFFARPSTMYPVYVFLDGGEDGDGQSRATWTYRLEPFGGGPTLASGISPLKIRPNGRMFPAGHQQTGPGRGIALFGVDFANQGIELWDVNEVPVTFDCDLLNG